jgi:F-type H+-transporting ATPase subunit gamma
MSGLKVIRRRINSVRNTKQITRAMKLVSAAKLRRAQDSAQNGDVFSKELGSVVDKLMADLSGKFSHPLLEKRETVNKRRILIIGGERGLCGGYNANLIKEVLTTERSSNISMDFIPIGRRAVSAARREGWKIFTEYQDLPEDASQWPTSDLAESLMVEFKKEECDEVVIYYTKFISALTQKVTREVLLPLESLEDSTESKGGERTPFVKGSTGYSPSAEQILTNLVPLLVKMKLYQAGLQSKASEHAARMTAMDAATNNANDLIDKLQLFYNRARQSTITRELIDIVGGAEAIK